MFPTPHPVPHEPAPSRRWHPLLAVPAVAVATLLMPPLGAALAFMARWDKAGRAVTVVLASIWFLVLVVAASGPKAAQDDAKPGALPAVTATVTVTATPPAPPASGPVPSATSAAPATPAPVASVPVPAAVATPAQAPAVPAPAQPQVPQAPPNRPRPPAADDGKARTLVDATAGGGSSSGGGSTTGGGSSAGAGGGRGVSYRNCTAVRAAGAAPIRRGDPGFGDHLDRDGDGVACE
ncbi:excalibur calcium-binding domain-containing protein [Streptomyces sp. NPDC006512]|uniref:excalibur calcium-binding domain-containing protein n=1 Tax=Streptomyces sp. NPDC006512 TaxID=3154307 RepID=UPI0033B15DA5